MPKTAPALVALILIAAPTRAGDKDWDVRAALMLAADPATPEPLPVEDAWPRLRDALHRTAVSWEIMDIREARYLLCTREDFAADLTVLRRRYQDLKDAPLIDDVNRFPDRLVINGLLQFNRELRVHLEKRLVWAPDRADLYEQALCETDWCYRCWDMLRDARADFYYISVRRNALKRLRDTIGTDAYNRGEMPPNVPLWRFYTN